MDKLLKGVMRYRSSKKENMVKQFLQVKNNPMPKAVFFTCIDSRMIPTRFTQTNVGDMFIGSEKHMWYLCWFNVTSPVPPLRIGVYNKLTILILDIPELLKKVQVRNAGNIVPHSHHFMDEYTTNEPAALELGCIVNDIRHIIVCGHSDCKAINLLHKLQDTNFASKNNRRSSPLRAWLCTHALSSLEKYQQLAVTDFSKPLIFQAETPLRRFAAYIDPDNKFNVEDKLSQINTLQQLQNIASYGFLKKRLEEHELHIHALWFDIYTGEIYYFSRAAKRFVLIDEGNIQNLLDEVEQFYS